MCGLVGLITNAKSGFFTKDLDIFRNMMFFDTVRGEDGTGVAIVNNCAGALVYKEGEEYSEFKKDINFKNSLSASILNGKALLGHNRKATVGGHKDENAHPFVYDDRYVFFHNGTLQNHKTFGNHEVDSEALGSHVVPCNGDITKLGEVFGKAWGAWACVWYDSVLHTVYLLRNKERPLYLAHLKDGNIAYASELWMINVAVGRNNGEVEKSFKLDEDKLYSISLDTLTIKEEYLPKKAIPQPGSPTNTHTGTVNKSISKKAAKELILDLNKQPWMEFYVLDAICHDPNVKSLEEAKPGVFYDWLITGYNPQYIGVDFKGILKNHSVQEVNHLMKDTNTIWGMSGTVPFYSEGRVEAWYEELQVYTGGYVC